MLRHSCYSPQSACDRAPVLRVTRLSPHVMMVPLLIGLETLSPPGQVEFLAHRVQLVALGEAS